MSALYNPFAEAINRSKWWFFQLLIGAFVILSIVLIYVEFMEGDEATPRGAFLFIVMCVLAAYMHFCSCVNRLRDAGRSGFWYLAFFLPYAGAALMVYFCGIEAGASNSSPSNNNPVGDDFDADEFLEKAKQKYGLNANGELNISSQPAVHSQQNPLNPAPYSPQPSAAMAPNPSQSSVPRVPMKSGFGRRQALGR